MKTTIKKFTTFSLFCGMGGEHLGKVLAFQDVGIYDNCQFWALNHWQIAIDTLQRNFPHTLTYCEDITKFDISEIGLKKIDMLWASPSCTHHSCARGGKPKDDQQRAHATEVYKRWLAKCDIPVFIMENVREFLSWGPLDEYGKPIKKRKGEYFNDFVQKIKTLGYEVDWRILNAADYGDPTTRKRLFLQAVKDGKGIHWPEPTHRNPKTPGNLPVWKSTTEYVIDWSIQGKSIYDRKIPLSPNTIKRIKHGLKTYGLSSYFLEFHGGKDGEKRVKSVNMPLGVQHGSNAFGLVQPYIMKGYGGFCVNPESSIDSPLPTVTTVDHNFLLQPFITENYTYQAERGKGALSIEQPMPTVTSVGRHNIIEAFIFNQTRDSEGKRCFNKDNPITTLTTKSNYGIIEPFIIEYFGNSNSRSTSMPLSSVLGRPHHYILQTIINKDMVDSLHVVRVPDDIDRHDFQRPFCIEINGAKYPVDITLRMLTVRELARAMGFPESFKFEKLDGSPLTKTDAVKMIGNACPVNTVRQLVKTVIEKRKGGNNGKN
ncbi:MAG: DNA (cytosine-5-)-methyltransferase [Planctomycetaceae bacterium]|jgi:DNA (cytosine-5)-methyltransferase 1|nr:DNA (cytosine-5-)-methyltransferase [Planctomycetaceae bacterium]